MTPRLSESCSPGICTNGGNDLRAIPVWICFAKYFEKGGKNSNAYCGTRLSGGPLRMSLNNTIVFFQYSRLAAGQDWFYICKSQVLNKRRNGSIYTVDIPQLLTFLHAVVMTSTNNSIFFVWLRIHLLISRIFHHSFLFFIFQREAKHGYTQ
jgi:hypothetical protein